MGLDARGYISVVVIVIYVPLACLTAFLVYSTGSGRRAGWVSLFLLSIVRVIGGSLNIAAEETSHPSSSLLIAAGVLENVGLSPLVLATLGFLKVVAQESLDQERIVVMIPRSLHLLNMVSVALSTFGGVKAGTAKNQDDLNSGENLRHIGGILYLVLYACLVLIHVWFWTQKRRILKYRRMLLAGISCALPFLFIRVMYSVLSGFSPAGIPGGPPPAQNDLSKFNSATGSWALYLLMAVVTEIIVVSIYLFVGIMFPVYKDYAIGKLDTGYESDVELSRGGADGKPFL